MSTKERLARAMEAASILARAVGRPGVPAALIAKARAGGFDDYEADSPAPIIDLVNALRRVGFSDLAQRAIDGEFDGTREEAEAWFEREGRGHLGATSAG